MKTLTAGFQRICEPEKTRQIERIARICYKSEDKIGPGSDIKMINNLLKRKHFAMLEHSASAFYVTGSLYDELLRMSDKWEGKTLSNTGSDYHKSYLYFTRTELPDSTLRNIVSGNFRAWYEFTEYLHKNHAGFIKQYRDIFTYISLSMAGILNEFVHTENYVEPEAWRISEITDFTKLTNRERMVHERFSIVFTVDRGITHEIVRMRDSSLAQESTRYVNYSNEKYGSEIAVITPYFFKDNPDALAIWKTACENSEFAYMALTKMGIPPQQARTVLPHSVKSDIAVTANLTEWLHIFELRACDMTGAAHPQMKEVMVPLLRSIQDEGTYDFAFGHLTPAEY